MPNNHGLEGMISLSMLNQDFNRRQTEVMLELLRASIFNREPHVETTEGIDWDRMMDSAGDQGILGWVWDGIQKLPTDKQPSRQQRINWGLSAQEIESSYYAHHSLLKYLVEECGKHDIRLLVLKGLTFSSLYPKPQLRSCGDIDIYTFGDFEKFNNLFAENYGSYDGEHHAQLYFDGTLVENHSNIIDQRTKQKAKLNNYLVSIMKDAMGAEGDYWVLPTMANFLFLTFHASKHIYGSGYEPLPLRSIVDYGVWIDANREYLEPKKCFTLLEDFGLEKSFEVLLFMSELILGLNYNCYHRGLVPQKHFEIIRSWIYEGYENMPLDKAQELGLKKYCQRLREIKKRGRYMLKWGSKGNGLHVLYSSIDGYVRAFLKVPAGMRMKDALRMRIH